MGSIPIASTKAVFECSRLFKIEHSFKTAWRDRQKVLKVLFIRSIGLFEGATSQAIGEGRKAGVTFEMRTTMLTGFKETKDILWSSVGFKILPTSVKVTKSISLQTN